MRMEKKISEIFGMQVSDVMNEGVRAQALSMQQNAWEVVRDGENGKWEG